MRACLLGVKAPFVLAEVCGLTYLDVAKSHSKNSASRSIGILACNVVCGVVVPELVFGMTFGAAVIRMWGGKAWEASLLLTGR